MLGPIVRDILIAGALAYVITVFWQALVDMTEPGEEQ
jgi:hypothetical protein